MDDPSIPTFESVEGEDDTGTVPDDTGPVEVPAQPDDDEEDDQ